ncbi:ferritin-like domain-containing protein [Kitasatospora sp. NPDC059571]|uniref:ferritin-like domain-containing protein n=1 Tax=Kitasatospora sp. NPDC059571 TaxID=3346871 RepID=UPI0036BAA1A0
MPAASVAALQAALAAEHAAVYGYGVVGARMPAGPRREDARAAYTAHQARRDALERLVGGARATPAPPAAGYRLPFAVNDDAAAGRLAAHLETRLTAVYADAVAGTTGPLRQTAAAALRETALRAAHWGAALPALPGLPDDATASGGASAAAAASPSPSA